MRVAVEPMRLNAAECFLATTAQRTNTTGTVSPPIYRHAAVRNPRPERDTEKDEKMIIKHDKNVEIF